MFVQGQRTIFGNFLVLRHFHRNQQLPQEQQHMGGRGVIGDKWSMRVLWMCALGSAVTLFMVAQERQLQNRQLRISEGLNAMESGAEDGEEV